MNKHHIRRAILFIVVITFFAYIINVQAQSFLIDSENLQEELAQRTLPDFTRAYQERVRIFDAWDEIKQSGESLFHVDIGIIDSGIDARNGRHPELEGIDLSGSTPFALRDRSVEFRPFPVDGHGTKVASIIGANNISSTSSANYLFPHMNGILAGVTDDYTLAAKTVLFAETGLTPSGFGVIVDSMKVGTIVNISHISRNSKAEDFNDFTEYWTQVFEGNLDKLFIIAAGNDNENVENVTPQNVNATNTIIVGAVDLDDNRSNFSNFGSGVDIAAPGENLYVPTIRGKGDFPRDVPQIERNYSISSAGTSFSAPMVTGVAGLIKAIKPNLTPAQIKTILTKTDNTDPVTTEFDKPIGRRLNAFKAVCDEDVLDCVAPPPPPPSDAPLWSTFQSNAQHTGRSSLIGPPFASSSDVTIKWQVTLDGLTEIQPLIGGDGTVYTLTAHTLSSFNGDTGAFITATTVPGIAQSFALGPDNTVYVCSRAAGAPLTAYTPDLGEKKWTFMVGGVRGCLSPVVSSDNIVYTAVPPPINLQIARIVAINADGIERWRYTEGNIAATSPALSNDETQVYVAFNKNLHAFLAKTTQPTPAPLWSKTGDFIFSFAPLVDSDDRVILSDTIVGLRAYSRDGTPLWTSAVGSSVQNPPTLDQSGNLLFARNTILNTIDSANGAVIATTSIQGNISGRNRTSVDGTNRKYVISRGLTESRLFAIDTDIVWEFPLVRDTEAPAIGNGILYITVGDTLYALGE